MKRSGWPVIEVEIEDEAWVQALTDTEEVTVRPAEAAIRFAASSRTGDSVAVLLTDDEAVRDLNRQFRGKDRATNVLSFPAADSAAPHLGDIALAYGVCAAEAQRQAKPLADHLAHLVVHGVLHLLGYDHETESDASVMEEMEREILRGFGIADPYAPRDDDGEL